MRATAILALIVSLFGCGDIYRFAKSGEVGWAIKKEIRDKQRKEIVLANITKFPWDEFFVFEAYTPTSEVCQSLSLSKNDCEATITSESTGDAEMLLVFRLNGKVVHSELHIAWHGDFDQEDTAPLTPKTVVFNVVAKGKLYNGEDSLGIIGGRGAE